MLEIIPLPAFNDNYIWLIANQDNHHCVVIDPGAAAPVFAALEKYQLKLDAILITHHHRDHVGGVPELYLKFPGIAVFGPATETIPNCNHPIIDNDIIDCEYINCRFRVIEIPGHTLGHVAYYDGKRLFCGDTLFAAGCGRLFEGSPAQMFASLTKLANLPDDTLIYCAHEYTQNNLRFAQSVEPNNAAIQQRIEEVAAQRNNNVPTLPSVLSLEKLTNPFLRSAEDSVISSLNLRFNRSFTNPVDIFQTLRALKDAF